MEIVTNSEKQTKHNGKNCRVDEYLGSDGPVDMAIAQIVGREPEVGWAQNAICTEVVYVISGSGWVEIEGTDQHRIYSGDVVRIHPGEKFFWNGELTLAIACSPGWYAEQYSVEQD